MLAALILSDATAAFNCTAKPAVTLPALAVRLTLCAVDTAATMAVKLALVAPEVITTEAGTTTEELLLARFTVVPPLGAAAVNAAAHASVVEPVMVEDAQEIEKRVAGALLEAEAARKATSCIIQGWAVLRDAVALYVAAALTTSSSSISASGCVIMRAVKPEPAFRVAL